MKMFKMLGLALSLALTACAAWPVPAEAQTNPYWIAKAITTTAPRCATYPCAVDATTQLQADINTAITKKIPLYIPRGVYNVSHLTITLPNYASVNIFGDSVGTTRSLTQGGTILQFANNAGTGLAITGTGGDGSSGFLRIDGITFDSSSAALLTDMVKATNQGNITLWRCAFNGSGKTGANGFNARATGGVFGGGDKILETYFQSVNIGVYIYAPNAEIGTTHINQSSFVDGHRALQVGQGTGDTDSFSQGIDITDSVLYQNDIDVEIWNGVQGFGMHGNYVEYDGLTDLPSIKISAFGQQNSGVILENRWLQRSLSSAGDAVINISGTDGIFVAPTTYINSVTGTPITDRFYVLLGSGNFHYMVFPPGTGGGLLPYPSNVGSTNVTGPFTSDAITVH